MSKLGLVIDEPLLASMRIPGLCEWCRKFCNPREVHHVFGRGARSCKRIDLSMFLMSLGSTLFFQCKCHARMTNGYIGLNEVLNYLAKRDGTSPQAIRDEHARMLRECGKGGRHD